MDGSLLTGYRRTIPLRSVILRRVVLSASFSLAVALGLLAIVFVSCRFSGAIVQPLPPAGLFALALVLIGLCTLPRLAYARTRQAAAATRTALLVPAIGATVSALVIFAAVSLPGTSRVALVLAWALVVVSECACWAVMLRRRGEDSPEAPAANAERARGRIPPGTVAGNSAAPQSLGAAREQVTGSGSLSPASRSENSRGEGRVRGSQIGNLFSSAALPAAATQQVMRAVDDDGADLLQGLYRACFAAGERTRNVHLVFCPPFADCPQLHCEHVEGPPATIKVAEVHTYGARLEVRLRSALPDAGSVTVRVEGRVPAAPSR